MEIRNKKGVFPVIEENNTVIVSTMELSHNGASELGHRGRSAWSKNDPIW